MILNENVGFLPLNLLANREPYLISKLYSLHVFFKYFKNFFLACRQLPLHYVLTWPFVCAHTLLVSPPLLAGTPVLLDLGSAI